MRRRLPWWVCALLVSTCARAALPDDARQALRRAVSYYRTHAAYRGGYVYYLSLDLRQRWGEGVVDAQTIVVQPPGTPTVGAACLAAWEATGEPVFLDAAREAAEALAEGQLVSGGWAQTISFGPAERLGRYRTRPGGTMNTSSLDDDQTQAALALLLRVDKALNGRHQGIRDAADYGLSALLAAQFASGGFPQVFLGPSPPRPALAASYPNYDWRTEGRIKAYWHEYTLNDGVASSVARTLCVARACRADARVDKALRLLGDWLLLARMPAPQQAWCQQYNAAMEPIWARRFEPPAISSWESMDVMETLIVLARETGDERYLEPIPATLAYLRACLLPDGRLARFYELRTNRPLYMDQDYQLAYDDSRAPSHYGWQQPSRLDAIEQRWRNARSGVPDPVAPVDEGAVRRIVADLDGEGRWVSQFGGEALTGQPKFAEGFRYLSSAVFARNVVTLSRWLAVTSPPGPPGR